MVVVCVASVVLTPQFIQDISTDPFQAAWLTVQMESRIAKAAWGQVQSAMEDAGKTPEEQIEYFMSKMKHGMPESLKRLYSPEMTTDIPTIDEEAAQRFWEGDEEGGMRMLQTQQAQMEGDVEEAEKQGAPYLRKPVPTAPPAAGEEAGEEEPKPIPEPEEGHVDKLREAMRRRAERRVEAKGLADLLPSAEETEEARQQLADPRWGMEEALGAPMEEVQPREGELGEKMKGELGEEDYDDEDWKLGQELAEGWGTKGFTSDQRMVAAAIGLWPSVARQKKIIEKYWLGVTPEGEEKSMAQMDWNDICDHLDWTERTGEYFRNPETGIQEEILHRPDPPDPQHMTRDLHTLLQSKVESTLQRKLKDSNLDATNSSDMRQARVLIEQMMRQMGISKQELQNFRQYPEKTANASQNSYAIGAGISEILRNRVERMGHHEDLERHTEDIARKREEQDRGLVHVQTVEGEHKVPYEWFSDAAHTALGGKWNPAALLHQKHAGMGLPQDVADYLHNDAPPRFRRSFDESNLASMQTYQNQMLAGRAGALNPDRTEGGRSLHECPDCHGGHNPLFYYGSKEEIQAGGGQTPWSGDVWGKQTAGRRRFLSGYGVATDKRGISLNRIEPKLEYVQQPPFLGYGSPPDPAGMRQYGTLAESAPARGTEEYAGMTAGTYVDPTTGQEQWFGGGYRPGYEGYGFLPISGAGFIYPTEFEKEHLEQGASGQPPLMNMAEQRGVAHEAKGSRTTWHNPHGGPTRCTLCYGRGEVAYDVGEQYAQSRDGVGHEFGSDEMEDFVQQNYAPYGHESFDSASLEAFRTHLGGTEYQPGNADHDEVMGKFRKFYSSPGSQIQCPHCHGMGVCPTCGGDGDMDERDLAREKQSHVTRRAQAAHALRQDQPEHPWLGHSQGTQALSNAMSRAWREMGTTGERPSGLAAGVTQEYQQASPVNEQALAGGSYLYPFAEMMGQPPAGEPYGPRHPDEEVFEDWMGAGAMFHSSPQEPRMQGMLSSEDKTQMHDIITRLQGLDVIGAPQRYSHEDYRKLKGTIPSTSTGETPTGLGIGDLTAEQQHFYDILHEELDNQYFTHSDDYDTSDVAQYAEIKRRMEGRGEKREQAAQRLRDEMDEKRHKQEMEKNQIPLSLLAEGTVPSPDEGMSLAGMAAVPAWERARNARMDDARDNEWDPPVESFYAPNNELVDLGNGIYYTPYEVTQMKYAGQHPDAVMGGTITPDEEYLYEPVASPPQPPPSMDEQEKDLSTWEEAENAFQAHLDDPLNNPSPLEMVTVRDNESGTTEDLLSYDPAISYILNDSGKPIRKLSPYHESTKNFRKQLKPEVDKQYKALKGSGALANMSAEDRLRLHGISAPREQALLWKNQFLNKHLRDKIDDRFEIISQKEQPLRANSENLALAESMASAVKLKQQNWSKDWAEQAQKYVDYQARYYPNVLWQKVCEANPAMTVLGRERLAADDNPWGLDSVAKRIFSMHPGWVPWRPASLAEDTPWPEEAMEKAWGRLSLRNRIPSSIRGAVLPSLPLDGYGFRTA